MALTPRQVLFVNEYLVDFDAKAAAIRAGYSKKGARVQAYRLMNNPEIEAEIDKLIEERTDKIHVTRNLIVQELVKIAISDIKDYVEVREFNKYNKKGEIIGTYKDFVLRDDFEDMDTSAIKEISYDKNGKINIKLWDKLGALNTLAKHKGMLKEQVEITRSENPFENLSTDEIRALLEKAEEAEEVDEADED